MQVELIAVDNLTPYARNARTHSPDQIAQIAASIAEFGFTNPILIGEDSVIIAGHGRLMAARQLGLEPTGHAARGIAGAPGVSTSNLYMEAGKVPVATLIEDIQDGVYVTELIGQGVNPVTGDYSRGAAGFAIRGGEIAGPVAGFTIAGNLLAMYRELTPANDLAFRQGVNVPTLRVDGMTVAGG